MPRWPQNTSPLPEPIDGCMWLRLTKNQFGLIDAIDSDLAEIKWYASQPKGSKTFYAGHATKLSSEWLHIVIGKRIGINGAVEHIDRNGLNCRRNNLRAATMKQNQGNVSLRIDNTSGFRGVSLDKVSGKWKAYIAKNRKTKTLGLFDNPIDAANERDFAAIEHFGIEFAWLNFEENRQKFIDQKSN